MWRRMLGDTAPIDGRLLAIFALVAFIGGGAKAIIHRAEKTSWWDVLAAAAAAAVAGWAVGSLLLGWWGPEKVYQIFPCVAIAGWLGMVLLDFVSGAALERVKSALGRKDDEPK